MLMSTNTAMIAPPSSTTLSGGGGGGGGAGSGSGSGSSVGLATVITGSSLPILPSAANQQPPSMTSTATTAASLSAIPSLTGPGSMMMPQQASLF